MKIRVTEIDISCAHFIETDGAFEPLHGHNIEVSAEVEGREDEPMVMDFRELRSLINGICDELDHRVIVPEGNPHLVLKRSEGCIEINTPKKRYRFPLTDVAVIPNRNSTVEEIGRYIFRSLKGDLPPEATLLSVGVSEKPGQEAVISWA